MGRHQTLEDLRQDLRDRSSLISSELLALVNANYASFLSLGDALRGGEERIEDVRVGVLGWKKAVQEVQDKVRERRKEVDRLGTELRETKGGIEAGRKMLELNERIEGLEGKLEIEGEVSESDTENEEDGEDGFVGASPTKFMGLAKEYVEIEGLADSIGRERPFVTGLEKRIKHCRATILIDLGSALKEARQMGEQGKGRVVGYLTVYGVLGAEKEGVQVIKALR